MSKVSSNTPPQIFPTRSQSNDSQDLLRLSRLQVSEYGFDYVDDSSLEDDDDPTTVGQNNSNKNNDDAGGDNGDHYRLSSLTEERTKNNDDNDVNFKRGEMETIRKVLYETEVIALKRTAEGFNQVNFSLGVLNCFFLSYVLGDAPQHLWLLYLLESLYMIPKKFRNMWRAKPLNEALYYLDFCWCMNFIGIALLALLLSCEVAGLSVSVEVRKWFFKALLGVSCGVLLSANIALPFVACVFHDVNTMTGLFIHLMPPMVVYTFWWHSDEITASWPKAFNFAYMDEIRYFGGMDSVAGCSTFLYFMWFLFYISFMLLVGINLPRKYEKNSGALANPKYDTVFHSTMRMGVCIPIGTYFRKRKRATSLKLMEENDFDTVDFFIYMMFHMILALGSIYTVGYGCFSNKVFHKVVLGGSVVLAVVRGANRYTYYSTKMYTRALRKEFAGILDQDKHQKGEYSRMD
mmetsp:Transcript_35126/g.75854  ORF Transcript_35126/g.75854 Transcript_35126/m.75854 type:complete len:462 (+) Transcript_35126:33-1418(+)